MAVEPARVEFKELALTGQKRESCGLGWD